MAYHCLSSTVYQAPATVSRGNPTSLRLFTMNPQKKFQLVFSLVMGAMMVFIMTFVITSVNVGFGPNFVGMWMKAFAVAYVVAVPVIFFVAPLARKMTGRILNMPV